MIAIAPHIHVALIGDRAVTLDTRADRFRLHTGRKARALAEVHGACAESSDESAIAALLNERLVVDADQRPVRNVLVPPDRGALELADPGGYEFPFRELSWTTGMVACRLRACRLDQVLQWATAGTNGTASLAQGADRLSEQMRVTLAHAFERGRMYVPLRRVCLRDSLVFTSLMRRRDPDAHLVMGVRLDPFGAHCWVQTDGLVLTGSFAAARELTPILVS